MSALSAMKCTPQKTMNSASGRAAASLGQLERVAGDVGELDHLVALVVVAEHEDPVAERGLGRAGPLDQVGVAGRGQVAGTVDAALGAGVAAAAQQQQGGGSRRRLVQLRSRHPIVPRARPQPATVWPARLPPSCEC